MSVCVCVRVCMCACGGRVIVALYVTVIVCMCWRVTNSLLIATCGGVSPIGNRVK